MQDDGNVTKIYGKIFYSISFYGSVSIPDLRHTESINQLNAYHLKKSNLYEPVFNQSLFVRQIHNTMPIYERQTKN